MRFVIAIVVLIIVFALAVCAYFSRNSDNKLAPKVMMLLINLIPPVLGNLVIISSPWRLPALIGSYIYFLGMDLVMYALLDFTMSYCGLSWPRGLRWIVTGLLFVDMVQLLANQFFGHAFALEKIMAYGAPYYRMIPYGGQTFHRILDYGIFLAVLLIFLMKTFRSSRINSERYSIILFCMLFTGLWETFYIVSRTPIDRSMIGFGIFGLLVYYFSLHYKPVLLLNSMLVDVASGLTEALFFFDEEDNCVWADDQGMRLLDLDMRSLYQTTRKLKKLFPSFDLHTDFIDQRQVVKKGEVTCYYDLEKHDISDRRGRHAGIVLSIQDVTEQHEALERERYIANHDSLTGLYTKNHLFAKVREQLKNHPDQNFVISYMDVNNFKMVNDVFGHDFGDYALKCLADSLKQNLPEGTLIGRVGGDCFGFCFTEETFDPDRAEQLMSTFTVKDKTHSYRMIIHQGAYLVTEREIDISVMFDRAHMALLTIKNDYKKFIAIYDEKMRERMLWEQKLAVRLPDAIAARELRPYLQAIVDMEGHIIGAEALVRWIHPEKGFLSPMSFIPAFEKNGMIADVDRYIWRCSCEILKRWKDAGRDDLFISINISPKDFFFMNVLEELKSLVDEYHIPASRLRIEITETLMMSDQTDRLLILKDLQAAGFLVEMDDFGSGYSSLNMLKNMPVDVIKVDMNFLAGSEEDRDKTATILRNVMNMVNGLGLSPLTEGVETEEQYLMLSEMGCRMFQGYYFAKPMPVEDFEKQYLGL